jgi:hypothetical protein
MTFTAALLDTREELIALPWTKILAEEHVLTALAAMAVEKPPKQPTLWAFKRKDGCVVIVHTLNRSMHLNRHNRETLDVFVAGVEGFPGQSIPPAERVFGSDCQEEQRREETLCLPP